MTVVCELVTDAHGAITRASPEAASLLGIEDRWLVRKPLATFVSGSDRQRFRTFLVELGADRSLTTARTFLFENRQGALFAAQLAATHVDGRLTWKLTADTELSEQEAQPTTTEPTERLFERLLNRLPTGVLVVNRQLRVVFANPAARRLLDAGLAIRPGEPLPETWEHYPLRSLAESLFTLHPEAGSHFVETPTRVVRVEGLAAGRFPNATLLLEDVTEREHTRQAERQFVENAAHELRTPLAAIVSVIDVLESGAKDEPQTRDRFLMHIRAHSERLVRLATSLLTLARIQTGSEQPRLDLVPLQPLLNEVAAGLAPAQGVEIEVDAPSHLAALSDRDLLHHVLENVAANAATHTKEGTILFAVRDLGRTIEIELSDTGTGMEPIDAAHAFDRFYRSPNENGNGFGLGLAIAEETMRVLGGTIRLDSTPGAGTRVRLGVPSARLVS